MYFVARVNPAALVDRARGVFLVYMWSGYVFILKWSLEPLFCTGAEYEGGHHDSSWWTPLSFGKANTGSVMITRPSISVRFP